jgi:hypothetical protein
MIASPAGNDSPPFPFLLSGGAMLSSIAKIWGILFVLVGVLGFIPAAAPNGHLLGVFHVNGPHNVVHLLTGFIALWAGYSSSHASKLYFLVFGIVYGLVSILGFIMGDRPLFGLVANNFADAWLHLGIAAVSIAFGLMPETLRVANNHSNRTARM